MNCLELKDTDHSCSAIVGSGLPACLSDSLPACLPGCLPVWSPVWLQVPIAVEEAGTLVAWDFKLTSGKVGSHVHQPAGRQAGLHSERTRQLTCKSSPERCPACLQGRAGGGVSLCETFPVLLSLVTACPLG